MVGQQQQLPCVVAEGGAWTVAAKQQVLDPRHGPFVPWRAGAILAQRASQARRPQAGIWALFQSSSHIRGRKAWPGTKDLSTARTRSRTRREQPSCTVYFGNCVSPNAPKRGLKEKARWTHKVCWSSWDRVRWHCWVKQSTRSSGGVPADNVCGPKSLQTDHRCMISNTELVSDADQVWQQQNTGTWQQQQLERHTQATPNGCTNQVEGPAWAVWACRPAFCTVCTQTAGTRARAS